MESPRPRSIDGGLLEQALGRSHQGFSADRVIADPELNAAFQAACAELDVVGSQYHRNRALMNRRKAGALSLTTTRRTSFNDDEYRFAAEIAYRIIERRDQTTLDAILCDPAVAEEFDEIAGQIAPGFMPVQYRWAALTLRKKRQLRPEIAVRLLRPEMVGIAPIEGLAIRSVPQQSGIYAFVDRESKATLYVGEASNLRSRLAKHMDHSDNRFLARHLWQKGDRHILVEHYVLPKGTSKRQLRAIEAEQIQRRKPLFNIVGLPSCLD